MPRPLLFVRVLRPASSPACPVLKPRTPLAPRPASSHASSSFEPQTASPPNQVHAKATAHDMTRTQLRLSLPAFDLALYDEVDLHGARSR